ncbi:MAG: hypothetical protein A3H72_03855 [Candidatus Doudnabacteria bacterium RIFCSPLOWO2_02_FULL_48_8]|nr:MAG: hypothetical protein A3H72_03855 [Candidatus Doudnabacteria bacterium RIFCSPLOWO2_02_FULL_48_8]
MIRTVGGFSSDSWEERYSDVPMATPSRLGRFHKETRRNTMCDCTMRRIGEDFQKSDPRHFKQWLSNRVEGAGSPKPERDQKAGEGDILVDYANHCLRQPGTWCNGSP